MSASICSNTHISAIVRWAAQNGLTCRPEKSCRSVTIDGNEDEVFALLHTEHVKSVNHRYGENNKPDGVYGYAMGLRPIEVIKAVDCLIYQSCEHPGWETSRAESLCESIRDAAIRRLPGYDAADWRIG